MKQRKVIVFGGAFSPPTLAHEALLRQCLNLAEFAEVWLLPSGNRTDKRISASPEHQRAMLKILLKDVFKDNPRLRIDDRELRRGISTETDDTYRELLSENPNTDFWFFYGADSYVTIHTWQNGPWLSENLPVLIAPRNGAYLPSQNSHVRILPPVPNELRHVSSTAVREALQNGEAVSGSVSESIADYIRTHELFV